MTKIRILVGNSIEDLNCTIDNFINNNEIIDVEIRGQKSDELFAIIKYNELEAVIPDAEIDPKAKPTLEQQMKNILDYQPKIIKLEAVQDDK